MYNVHCTNTILHNYGVQRNTPPSSANINRLNWEGGCYVSRILLISHWQNDTNIHTNTATNKHMKSHYWKTPTLRTTHRNPKTRTHKIQTSIKTHKHWQTLMDRPKTAVPYILGFHVTAFCPAISPISSQSLIEMKVLQQCLSASYSCPTSMPQLLYSCSQFFTALVQFNFFQPLSFFLSFPESKRQNLDNVQPVSPTLSS